MGSGKWEVRSGENGKWREIALSDICSLQSTPAPERLAYGEMGRMENLNTKNLFKLYFYYPNPHPHPLLPQPHSLLPTLYSHSS